MELKNATLNIFCMYMILSVNMTNPIYHAN